MQKSIVLLSLSLFLFSLSFAQAPLRKQAVLTKSQTGFKVGDTLDVARKNKMVSQETGDVSYNFTSNDVYGNPITIPSRKVRIISKTFTPWKEHWFWDREDSEPNRPFIDEQTAQRAKRLLRELAAHDLFLNDPMLEDYLLSILAKIYGPEDASFFPDRPYIKILKAQSPFAAGLEDGAIVLSTALLASTYNEAELEAIISAQLAHILLGHTKENAKKFTVSSDFYENLFSADLLTFSTSSWLQYNKNMLSSSYQLAGELRADMGEKAIQAFKAVGAFYTDDQLITADRIAKFRLRRQGKDPDALGFLLNRIKLQQFYLPSIYKVKLSNESFYGRKWQQILRDSKRTSF